MSYRRYIAELEELLERYRPVEAVDPAPDLPELADDAPVVLIFSPHPDDECIIGGLPLRLRLQGQAKVVNVAVTQGSSQERQAARLEELEAACDYLSFELETIGEQGLEQVNPLTRRKSPETWDEKVAAIKAVLETYQPQMILFPHEDDWNKTHIGVNLLVMDALAEMPKDFACTLVETEYWGALYEPNLMIELGADELGLLVNALVCHEGEVSRNPYHLSLPLWMIDAVRRGSEIIGGQGAEACDFSFATLYRWQRWEDGVCQLQNSLICSLKDDLASLLL